MMTTIANDNGMVALEDYNDARKNDSAFATVD